MSAEKFKQLSEAFLKISQGFAEVADLMGSNLEPANLDAAVEAKPESSAVDLVENLNVIDSPMHIGESSIEEEEEEAVIAANSALVESSGDSQPPTKKAKKIKDPNAPRRPLNTYFLFQRDYRAILLAQNANMPFAEITAKVKEAFDKLSPAEKAKYEAEFRKDSERYAEEMKLYSGVKPAEESSPIMIEEVEKTKKKEKKDKKEAVELKATSDSTIPTPSATPVPVANEETPQKKKKSSSSKRESEVAQLSLSPAA